MRRNRLIGITLIALALAGAGAVSWRAWHAGRPSNPPVPRADVLAPAAGREALLEQSLQAIADGERASARDRWDVTYVADLLGKDADAHLQWVRTQTAWVPYRGVLRGSVGVLLDRQGNGLDRALLLAALLDRAGHQVRLARGELASARARALLPVLERDRAALGRNSTGAAEADWRDHLRLATGAYRQDSARIARSIEARLDSAMQMLATLDARTEEQSARLRTLVPDAVPGGQEAAGDSLLAALRDHWWVQRYEGGRWLDLDVLGIASDAAEGLTARATYAPAALDSALYHRVVVRLVTERVSGGTLIEQRTLQREIRPAALIGQPAVLLILPAGYQPGIVAAASDPAASLRKAALEEREWRAILAVGGEAAEAVITLGRGATTASGNPFGGLGQGIAGALDQGSDDLSAAWLEYEIHAPERAARVIRRQLFDLVGPAARASKHPVRLELTEERRLQRSLALTRTTEILPLGAAVAPEYLLHLTAKAALANRNFLRASGPPPAQTLLEAMDRFAESVVQGPSHLLALAAVRMSADPDAEVFLDQPNVLSRHAYLTLGREGIMRIEATDIVANDVAAAPGTPDPAGARRRQGVRDTNAEALLYGAQPVAGSVADAFTRSASWVTITVPDDPRLAGLPADIRQRMVDDMAEGYVVVAPASLATTTRPDVAGWWRIDPRTGETLGISGMGWGGTMAERALKYSVILGTVVVEAWMFEFLRCINGIGEPPGATGPVARAGSPLDWFVTPAWAQEGQSLKSVCVWEAWRAALTAGMFYKASVVWGLVVKQARLYRLLRFRAAREAMKPGGGGSAGGTPTGGKPPGKAPPECPPGQGAPGGTAEEPPPIPGKGSTEEPGVGGPEGAQPGEKSGPPPAEPAPRPPEEAPVPFDEAWGDLPPMESGYYAKRSEGWAAAAPEAEVAVGEQEKVVRDALAEVRVIEQEIAAIEGPPSNADVQQLNTAKFRLNLAQQTLARLQTALNRIRALVEQYRRLEALNEALLVARAEAREASESFARLVRSRQADFESNQYVQWRKAVERYEQALKEYAAAKRAIGNVPNAPAPSVPGQNAGGTLPLPGNPIPPGDAQAQCANTGPSGNASPGASPPPQSPPPASPPPPGQAAEIQRQREEAQRRLAEAERELEAAKGEVYRLDHTHTPDGKPDLGEFTKAERELYAREQELAKQGKELGPHDDSYLALLRRKIEAVDKVLKLLDQVKSAQLVVQGLEQAGAAGAAASPAGPAPQLPGLVGLGAMSAP